MIKNLPCNARDTSWIPDLERSEPHMANGYCTEQGRSKGLANNPKFIMKLSSSCMFHVSVLESLYFSSHIEKLTPQ